MPRDFRNDKVHALWTTDLNFRGRTACQISTDYAFKVSLDPNEIDCERCILVVVGA